MATTLSLTLTAQRTVEDFGYRKLSLQHQGDEVEILVKSKKGEAETKKPILVLIRGSLAKPLVKYNDEGGHYPPFPFDQSIFLDDYHLVSINKPGIPLIANVSELGRRGESVDPKTGRVPSEYVENNFLQYYVDRNCEVIDHLSKQLWVDQTKIVVAGHSQGSDIAARMASRNPRITHLIYSSGSPYYSTILDMVRKQREREAGSVEGVFELWGDVVKNPDGPSQQDGWDTNRTISSFSQCQNEILKSLSIPVLITFGTEDTVAPFNDMFRVETMRDRISTITFKAYSGAEHNYFGVSADGEVDYQQFGWDDVGRDWLEWLS